MPIFHVSNGSASRLPAQPGFQRLELFLSFRQKVLAFGSDVDERYLKQTINYWHSRNFCEVVPQKRDLVLGFDAEQLDVPRKALFGI